MKLDEFFDDIDDKTAERLADRYPLLDDERKARLYTMSKRKINSNNEPETNSIEVSGVDKYSRPKWYRSVSIAAAAVLVVAGIGGSTFFISRNSKDKGPAASVSGNTAAAVTETISESATEAISEGTVNIAATEAEGDANAIAKELTDAYAEFTGDIYGSTLEVDKANVLTKEFDDQTKEYYRVTDSRYPTWEAIEKRCNEIFDAEFAKAFIHNLICDGEEVAYGTLMYKDTDGSLYIDKQFYDNNSGPIKWNEDEVNAEFVSDKEITVTLPQTISADQVIEVTFTITNTENGWRISKVHESGDVGEYTSPDAIANELVSAYGAFFSSFCTGDLEYDKSDVITKNLVSSEDGSNITIDYYRVTDSRLAPGYDLKGDCFEIFDDELANSMYEQICCDEDNVTDKTPIIKRKDGSYYISECFYYEGDKLESWDQDTINGTLNPDGTITTVLSKTFENVTNVEEFTFVNTECGWRIGKVDYKSSASDSKGSALRSSESAIQ